MFCFVFLFFLHTRAVFATLTQDFIEEVHKDQHSTHQGHKNDHFDRRVQGELSTVCFAFSSSGHTTV